jgi:branched-chain amino acid transport system permease protein
MKYLINLVRTLQEPKGYFYLGVLLLILLFSVIVKNEFVLHLMILALLYGGIASAWNILGGMTGQFSLGHGAFFGIGAYTSTFLFLDYGISPWLGMLVGGVIACLLGVVVFYPSFRLREFYFVIATLAFLEITRSMVTYWRVKEGGIDTYIPYKPSLFNMVFASKQGYVLLMFGYLLVLVLVGHYITNSKLGYYIRAVGEDNDAAEMLGISSRRNKIFAMLISAFFTAIGGVLYVQYLLFVTPSLAFGMMLSILFALFAVIGGIGSLAGPIVGAFLLTILDTFFRARLGGAFGAVGSLFYGLILIVVVIFMPSGVFKWIQVPLKGLFGWLPKLNIVNTDKYAQRLAGEDVSVVDRKDAVVEDKERTSVEKKAILEVSNLTKKFAGLTAVSNLSFKVFESEILGLIGPNGSGKTTTFNLLSGFLKPTEGIIVFRGDDITKKASPDKACRRGIGRTFQIVKPFSGMTVLENVIVGALLKRNLFEAERYALGIIKTVGLGDYESEKAANLPIPLLKRLELAKALSTDPTFILLDEVMSGLNFTEKMELARILKELQTVFRITLMVIEHDMKSIMSLSERIIVINYGRKIAEGSPAEISKNPDVVKAYLGEEIVLNAEG